MFFIVSEKKTQTFVKSHFFRLLHQFLLLKVYASDGNRQRTFLWKIELPSGLKVHIGPLSSTRTIFHTGFFSTEEKINDKEF